MKNILIIIAIALSFSSCMKFALNATGVLDNQATVKEIEYKTKKVFFMEMHHVGTRLFYEDVKRKVDSFAQKGYEVLYEGVIYPEYLSLEEKVQLVKKHRKITGTSGNLYLDTINNRINGKKIPKGIKLVNQPDNNRLFRVKSAKNIDVQLDSLIHYFEKNKGEIVLSKCDMNTDLYSVYNCETLPKSSRDFYSDSLLVQKRNQIIVAAVKNSGKNVLIVYGKMHFKGVKKLLEEHKRLENK